MHKLAAFALVGALGIGAMGSATPAEARVVVGVGIGLPGVTLVAPYPYTPAVGWYAPYYYGPPYAYGPGFVRFGYGFRGYGYRGYGYHGYGAARGGRRR